MKKYFILFFIIVWVGILWFGGWYGYKYYISDYKYVIACQNSISEWLKDPFSVKWGEFKIELPYIFQKFHAKNSYWSYEWDEYRCIIENAKIVESKSMEKILELEKLKKEAEIEEKQIEELRQQLFAKFSGLEIITLNNILQSMERTDKWTEEEFLKELKNSYRNFSLNEQKEGAYLEYFRAKFVKKK